MKRIPVVLASFLPNSCSTEFETMVSEVKFVDEVGQECQAKVQETVAALAHTDGRCADDPDAPPEIHVVERPTESVPPKLWVLTVATRWPCSFQVVVEEDPEKKGCEVVDVR